MSVKMCFHDFSSYDGRVNESVRSFRRCVQGVTISLSIAEIMAALYDEADSFLAVGIVME